MSGVRLFFAGLSAILNITILYLLVFINGMITQMMTLFLLGADYGTSMPGMFGMDMVPVIQAGVGFIALIGALVSVWVIYQEAFGAVTYVQEY